MDAPHDQRHANVRGAAWMTASMFCFTGNDTLVKRIADDLPLFQVIFIRGLMLVALLGLVVRVGETGMTAMRGVIRDRALLARVALETVGTATFLLTLTKVPIAALAAVVQLVPLAVTFAAARLLREQVSIHRIGALAVGFVGVLFVIRPGTDDFSPWFLLGIATVGIVVARELATRRVDAAVPSGVIAFATAVATTTMGGVVSIFEGWKPADAASLGWIVLAAVFLTGAYISSVSTIRTGDVSFSALFRYSALVFAIVVQILVFDDVPDVLTFVGSAIIVVAGIYTLRHERIRRIAVANH